MREIEIGVRYDLKNPPSFFGMDEVNAAIRSGAVVKGIDPGGLLMRKLGESPETVQMTISGFAAKVKLSDADVSPISVPAQDVMTAARQSEPNRRIAFKLSSGRTVWAVRFHYHGTYDSLLEGRPNAGMNQRIIESDLKKARLRPNDPVLLLRPTQQSDVSGGVYLPAISCCAELMSLPMNAAMHGSWLTVVWYASPFFDRPLASFVEESLKQIAWEENARDFEF